MQSSKLLESRRKTYILDVICNIFYFGEVQEEVLGQCSGQGISAAQHPEKKMYLSISVLFQKKNEQRGWGNAFVNTPLKFLGFALKFWENRSSLQLWFDKGVQHPLQIPRPKKGTPKLCRFLLITLANSTHFLIHSRKLHML